MKKIYFALFTSLSSLTLSLFLLPIPALAHVKWFAEATEPARPYSFTDIPVLAWILVTLALVYIGTVLEKKIKVPNWFTAHIPKVASTVLSLASVGFGLAFLIFSYYGFIFAPNLLAEGTFGTFLLAFQAVAGFMILFGIYERIGGILLIGLFALGIKQFGAYEMVDTLEMLGMAFYVIIVGRPKWCVVEAQWIETLVHKFKAYGVPILRVGTGLNLIALGFTEKILTPELTQNFLANHDWNFMYNAGLTFYSNYWFAFSAGAAEAIIGLFFVLGLITRITTLVLAGFLVTTLVLLGPVELIGHLPHFSIAIVLLVMGAGARLKLSHS
jgi:uncharacterized membrane protein YphA (DoxX/SURF4 family)